MQQVLIIIVLLLLIGAAAMTLVLDARQQTHRSSGGDRSVDLTSGEHTVHSSRAGRVPVAVFPTPGQLPDRTFLLCGAPNMWCWPASSQRRQSSTPIASWDFPFSTCLSRLSSWPSWWCAACLDGSAVASPINCFDSSLTRSNMVTSAVRSGLPVNEAFRTIAREMPQPTAGQFAIVCSELALGRPPEEAVEGVYQRTQVAEYGFFAVTLGVQMKSGGGLAETLQTLADTVRQRVTLAARAKALAGEVIFSARALSLAPVYNRWITILDQSANRRSPVLLTRREGSFWPMQVASVLVGTLVIRWMIRRDTAL